MSRDRVHDHKCRNCDKPFACDGAWIRNYDGWPEAICHVYHELGIDMCERCMGLHDADDTETAVA